VVQSPYFLAIYLDHSVRHKTVTADPSLWRRLLLPDVLTTGSNNLYSHPSVGHITHQGHQADSGIHTASQQSCKELSKMKIIDKINASIKDGKTFFSFEFFPPSRFDIHACCVQCATNTLTGLGSALYRHLLLSHETGAYVSTNSACMMGCWAPSFLRVSACCCCRGSGKRVMARPWSCLAVTTKYSYFLVAGYECLLGLQCSMALTDPVHCCYSFPGCPLTAGTEEVGAHNTAQHSTAQRSAAQHSSYRRTKQCSTYHSTAAGAAAAPLAPLVTQHCTAAELQLQN